MVLADSTCDSRRWPAICRWVLGLAISGQSMCCYRARWPFYSMESTIYCTGTFDLVSCTVSWFESCTGSQMWVAHLGLLGCAPCGCRSGHNPGNLLQRSQVNSPLFITLLTIQIVSKQLHNIKTGFFWVKCISLLNSVMSLSSSVQFK